MAKFITVKALQAYKEDKNQAMPSLHIIDICTSSLYIRSCRLWFEKITSIRGKSQVGI